MTTALKTPTRFSVYQSETSKKYFVKYEGKEEKEITKMEFIQLKSDLDRIYENSVSEPVVYEQKDKTEIIELAASPLPSIAKLTAHKHESLSGVMRFKLNTCYGMFYETSDSVVVDCIFNSQKGNGSFRMTLWLFASYSCKNRKSLVMSNLNQQLIDSLKNSDMPLKVTQITKNTITLQ